MICEIEGAPLHYEVIGAGEPLLWLHGHMGTGADWQHIFPAAPAGYCLVAPDQRGHGRSGGAGEQYSFAQSAGDMFALLDRLGIGTVRLLGVSGGGITALHMATRQPERIRQMTIVSAPPTFPPQARAIQRIYTEDLLPEAERAAMRQRHPRPGQLATLFAQVHAFAESRDPSFSATDLERIQAETLIVFGDRDPLYPLSQAVELRAAIPRSWLWVVPHGGHAPVFGAHAPAFARTVLDFFAGAYA